MQEADMRRYQHKSGSHHQHGKRTLKLLQGHCNFPRVLSC